MKNFLHVIRILLAKYTECGKNILAWVVKKHTFLKLFMLFYFKPKFQR